MFKTRFLILILIILLLLENITCSCVEHKGRELLNQTFDFSPNFIFTCIFGESDFSKTYRYTRGFRGMNIKNLQIIK